MLNCPGGKLTLRLMLDTQCSSHSCFAFTVIYSNYRVLTLDNFMFAWDNRLYTVHAHLSSGSIYVLLVIKCYLIVLHVAIEAFALSCCVFSFSQLHVLCECLFDWRFLVEPICHGARYVLVDAIADLHCSRTDLICHNVEHWSAMGSTPICLKLSSLWRSFLSSKQRSETKVVQ